MTNKQGQRVCVAGDFVIVRDFAVNSESFVIGHQYFLDNAGTAQPSEISYSHRSLLEGDHRIPWSYQIPKKPAASHGLVLTARTVTLAPGTATRISSYYDQISAEAPACRGTVPWGYFSNVCPDGCLLTFFEFFGHLNSAGEADL